jgi:hypothetical protein
MKSHQLSLLAVLLTSLLMAAVGCTKKPGDRLVGQWQGSTRLGSVGQGVEAQFVGAAMGRIQMTAEFRSDGTMRSSVSIGGLADDNPWEGPWRVIESGPDRLVIELTAEVDGQTVQKQAEIEFLSDDQIALSDPGDTVLTEFILDRVK